METLSHSKDGTSIQIHIDGEHTYDVEVEGDAMFTWIEGDFQAWLDFDLFEGWSFAIEEDRGTRSYAEYGEGFRTLGAAVQAAHEVWAR